MSPSTPSGSPTPAAPVNGGAPRGGSDHPAARLALALLTVLNFLNYLDRYVLAAVLERVKADPAFAGVSDAKLGALQTAFFYSYMVLAPIAGTLGHRVPRRYLVAAGALLWSLATFASGLARGYDELLLARAFIGCGEAGYAAVAPALLSDLFSRSSRNRVLSLFYLATPVGSALGFIVGGLVAEAAGWRAAFFCAGAPGIVLAFAALLLPEPRRGAQDAAATTRDSGRFSAALLSLAKNRAYLRVTVGGALMTFALGGLAFWMPSYFQEARGLGVAAANSWVGGLAVCAGLVGTLTGARLGDRWQARDPFGYLRLSGYGLALATPFLLAMSFLPLGPCLACLFAANFFAFVNTGPLNTALVESVPAGVREAAVGLNIFCIHAFGDAVSPPLLGGLATYLGTIGFDRPRALGLAVSAVALPCLLGGMALLARLPARRSAAPER